MNKSWKVSYPHHRLISTYGQPKRFAEKAEIVWNTILAPDEETARQLMWDIMKVDAYEVILAEDWRKRERRFF